jgi:diaminopimelate decarboxylase
MEHTRMFHFAYDEAGRLRAEDCELEAIARSVSTPTFVYAHATLVRHFRVFDDAFAGHPHLVCYSVKANSNGALLRLFGSMGSGADIVSGGELMRALKAGIPPDRIVFSGVGKSDREMIAALDAKILAFNVESEPELELLDQIARERRTVAPVSLRVNPDVDAKTHPYIATGLHHSKFGIPLADARRIAARARDMKGIVLHGIDCHIGSQLVTIDPLLEALRSLLHLVDALEADGHRIADIDLGGGLGIPYIGEAPPHPSVLGQAVTGLLAGRKQRLILEPGRVIVGNAGILLTRVLYVKKTPTKTFVIVDAAMNDLIRPALYKAHHDLWPVRKRGRPQIQADVVGPICESSDTFAKDRLIEQPEPGDLWAIMSAGAYGFCMSSNYNSRPRAAEVMVRGQEMCVIRAREPMDVLTEGESVPNWF